MDNAPKKKTVLFAATLASFLVPFMSSSMNVALPSIGSELEMDAILLSWVVTSFLLASSMLIVPFGRIADIYGRKLIFKCGTIVFTVSSLLLSFSNSAMLLIALRVVQGIGGAMIFTTSVAILTSVFPVGERGKALGINVAAVYSGLSLGPVLGGVLTQHFGWRSIFLATVPLGVIVIAFVFWKLDGEWAEARGEKFDIAGSIIYALMLVAVIYGFSLLPEILGMWLILAGVLIFLVFIRWETKASSPVLDIDLFRRNRTFAFSSLAALINYGATFAVAFLMSLYLQYIKGFSPQTAGFVLLSQPVMQAVFSPLAGRISDRVQPRIVASTGMSLTVVGLLLFTFLDEETALAFIVASLLLLGFGFALFSSPNTNAIMSSVEKKFYGVASAIVATMRQIGMLFSMGITMILFSVYMGRVQITPEYYMLFLKTVRTAFVIFTILCLCGVFASLARGKVGEADR